MASTRKTRGAIQDIAGSSAPQGQNVDRPPDLLLSSAMDQTQPDGQLRRVDTALTRLESMVDERLRDEQARADDLARRLLRLEEQYEELKKVAMDVEGRLERAMEYIRSPTRSSSCPNLVDRPSRTPTSMRTPFFSIRYSTGARGRSMVS